MSYLIVGASSGLGRDLAYEFAKNSKNLTLISRDKKDLEYLKSDIESLRSRDTKGLYLATDKGLINNLIGYSKINPYDEPNNAEVVIETGNHVTISDSREQLFGYVNKSCMIV